MKQIITLILVFILSNILKAQTHVITDENGQKVTVVGGITINNQTQNGTRYRGSILYNDYFEMGRFVVKQGAIFEKPILFNIFENTFLAKFDEQLVGFEKTDFTLGEHQFMYLKGVYLESIFESKVKFMVRTYCKVKPYDNAYRAKINNEFAGQIIREKQYYLLFPDGKLRGINLSRYSLRLALEMHYPSLESLLKEYSYKIETEEDVIKLLSEPDLQGYFDK